MLPAGNGNDLLVGEGGTDTLSAGDGNDNNLARDGVAEAVICGVGTDSLTSDTIDTTPANDCETVSSG